MRHVGTRSGLLALLLVGLGCESPSPSESPASPAVSLEQRSPLHAESANAPSTEPATVEPPSPHAGGSDHGYWEPGIRIWSESNFRQTLYATDFQNVEVVDEVLDPSTGSWQKFRHADSTSFSFLHLASATKNVFAFAGLAQNGDFVLERWVLGPASASAAEASPPTTHKKFDKLEIYRGYLGTGVAGVGFDPEERFLLVLLADGEARTLFRFDNRSGASPVPLMDSVTMPALGSMQSMDRLDHRSLGRVWVLDADIFGPTPTRMMLVDSDNDGSFDGEPLIGDHAYFRALGLDAYEDWDPLLGPW